MALRFEGPLDSDCQICCNQSQVRIQSQYKGVFTNWYIMYDHKVDHDFDKIAKVFLHIFNAGAAVTYIITWERNTSNGNSKLLVQILLEMKMTL